MHQILFSFFLLLPLFSLFGTEPSQKELAPHGMVWIPSGSFLMGSDSKEAKNDEQPVHLVHIDGFWMDETCVTNEEFARFVEETGYITTAERAVIETQENEKTCPHSPFLFKKPEEENGLFDHSAWWQQEPGACWKRPNGAGSSIEGKEKHPVVHVSWEDAQAYATWAKKRLPTEAEWEYAARSGNNFCKYAWGNDEFCEERPQANLWHGHFPHKSSKDEEMIGPSPVKSYCPNSFKLYDMAGNVWQWCSDYYDPGFYSEEAQRDEAPSINPKGPKTSKTTPSERVQRGGSFLCHESYCKGYRTTARMKAAEKASFQHSGFRCAL